MKSMLSFWQNNGKIKKKNKFHYRPYSNKTKNIGRFSSTYVFKHISYSVVLASFSNTLYVIFQVAAFYQIWQACFFHDTLPQLLYLSYPVDIYPRCSPTFSS